MGSINVKQVVVDKMPPLQWNNPRPGWPPHPFLSSSIQWCSSSITKLWPKKKTPLQVLQWWRGCGKTPCFFLVHTLLLFLLKSPPQSSPPPPRFLKSACPVWHPFSWLIFVDAATTGQFFQKTLFKFICPLVYLSITHTHTHNPAESHLISIASDLKNKASPSFDLQ